MSYEHGTIHYNLPQTTDSDTRDWFDSNEAFEEIDAAIYSATQDAAQAIGLIETVTTDISGLKEADIAMTGRVNGIESRVSVNETTIRRLENATADNKQDLMDAICSIEEPTATATYRHLVGEFFWYNNTLYKASTNIAIGQQIVPDTNCSTTNITTELLVSHGGAEIDDQVVSANKAWSSYKTREEINNASAVKTGDTRWFSGKIQYYDGSAWQDIEIGGGGMPILDYANPITYSSGMTLNEEAYVFISANTAYRSGAATFKIDNTAVASVSSQGDSPGGTSVPAVFHCGAGNVLSHTGSLSIVVLRPLS